MVSIQWNVGNFFPRQPGDSGCGRPFQTASESDDGTPTLEQVERDHIRRVLTKTISLAEAARKLGISAATLWRKRKRYKLEEVGRIAPHR